MKVLMLGQLPKEVGGSYTTGICNVTYEVSKQKMNDVELIVMATNMSDKKAVVLSNNTCSYCGYVIRPFAILGRIIFHPLRTIKEWKYNKRTYRLSNLKWEVYKDSVAAAVKKYSPDIVHCMNAGLLYPLHFARLNNDFKSVVTFHGLYMVNSYYNAFINGLRGYFDFASGLTNETKENFVNMFHFQENIMTVIPNGTDTKKFYYSDHDRKIIRNSLGVNNEQIIFLTVGSVYDLKGQYRFSKIIKKLPMDCQYWIIGQGEDCKKISQYIEENNLHDKVKMLGYVNNTELYKYYSAADIYAHVSKSEGQALSEVESYACDMKTIINKTLLGSVVTDVNNRTNYYQLDFEDIDFDNFVDWSSCRKENRTTRSEYDWSVIGEMYSAWYHDILTKPSHR